MPNYRDTEDLIDALLAHASTEGLESLEIEAQN